MKIFLQKRLDFSARMRYNSKAGIRRGILIGKEPHWKCGVPQGIVRSSRILSANKESVGAFPALLTFSEVGYVQESTG